MTNPNTPLDPEKQPALVRVDAYQEWRRREGVPLVGGVYIKDMKAVEVGPWPRKGDGVNGALCYLDGDDEGDEHIVELPPEAPTAPLRHMYTEATYVVSGHGSTSVWRDKEPSRLLSGVRAATLSCRPTLGTNSLTPAFHAARWFSVTDLPQLLRQWASEDFVFNNPYDFNDRYAGEPDYFTAEAKLYRGRVWETNFIPTSRSCRSTSGRAAEEAVLTPSW